MSKHSLRSAAYQRRRAAWLASGVHGWRCWLNGCVVNPHAKYGEPDSATVDHVVPQSPRGGGGWADPMDTSLWRLACHRCNSARRDHTPPLGRPSRTW